MSGQESQQWDQGFYWKRFEGGRVPAGRDLAALRTGEGRAPFTAPAMWPYFTRLGDDRLSDPGLDRFDVPPEVAAEHHALVLYAIHQQSQPASVHSDGASFAQAVRRLHTTGRFSQEAVDRRFLAAVTAVEVDELAHHLRSLIRQLRSLPGITPIDYSQLFEDLRRWAFVDSRDRVRRRWGRDYHWQPKRPEPDPATSTADATT